MNLLYVTADRIGTPTGGGAVTYHESSALKELGTCGVWDREHLQKCSKIRIDVPDKELLQAELQEPWLWDNFAVAELNEPVWDSGSLLDYGEPKLAHFYAGTFGKTVAELKRNGCKVVYTIAAHDREVSRREHEGLGIPFTYPHLVEEPLWQRYIEGYRLADVIVCPSSVAAATVRAYGPDFERKRIEVIPHGCEVPERCPPLPGRFTVGYLGAIGPDKGVRYLLEAWKKLNYKDATLVIAGRESTSPFMLHMLSKYGGGNVRLMGWVDDVSDFYGQISLYVQPSATEGFGIEVLEAMAHGRPVICSTGAGAVDVVREAGVGSAWYFDRGINDLTCLIDVAKRIWNLDLLGEQATKRAFGYTWDKVRERYKVLWSSLL